MRGEGSSTPTAQDTSTQQQQYTAYIEQEVPSKKPADSFPDNLLSPEMLKVEIQKCIKAPAI
jgi:hypothetical protein